MSAPHTIVLISRSYLYREGILDDAATPITPGMLLAADSGGDKPRLIPHATAAAAMSALTPPMVACEMPERYGSGIDDPYNVTDETVLYYIPERGDHLYMFLEAAGNVAANAILESNGAGALQAATTGGGFRALEAVDNSGGAVAARIRVEVL